MKNERLDTPFGKINILIDGVPVPYTAKKGDLQKVLFPDLLGRYQIFVHSVPDGSSHTIACVFDPVCRYERTPDSDERLECQSFYNDDRIKMSVGLVGDDPDIYGYDYDVEYLENGMAYKLWSDTVTEEYVFGIAWIDDCGWDDDLGNEYFDFRDIQTTYGADPALRLIITDDGLSPS